MRKLFFYYFLRVKYKLRIKEIYLMKEVTKDFREET